jgi:hypothetical protein
MLLEHFCGNRRKGHFDVQIDSCLETNKVNSSGKCDYQHDHLKWESLRKDSMAEPAMVLGVAVILDHSL